MKKIVNLLTNPVNIRISDEPLEEISLPENTNGIRLDTYSVEVAQGENDLRIIQTVFVHNNELLPPEQEGTLYIVPKRIANLYKDLRHDLVFPATNPLADGAIYDDKICLYVRFLRAPDHLLKHLV